MVDANVNRLKRLCQPGSGVKVWRKVRASSFQIFALHPTAAAALDADEAGAALIRWTAVAPTNMRTVATSPIA